MRCTENGFKERRSGQFKVLDNVELCDLYKDKAIPVQALRVPEG
jgi:hypothetical protein